MNISGMDVQVTLESIELCTQSLHLQHIES